MEIEKDGKNRKYYKIKLCDLYEKNKKCYRGDNCNYAHEKDELKDFKKICNFGLNCFKKDCHFTHPDNWNPEDNKKICEYYINGFCKNEDSCKFKHIIEDIKINEKKDDLDITNNNDFQLLEKNINSNIIEESINKNDDKDTQEFLDDMDDNIKDKKNNSNFEIFINGVKYIDNIGENDIIEDVRGNIKIDEKMDKEFNNTYINKNYNKENIEDLISKLQNDFEKYTKDIKNNIDNIFIESKQKYGIDMKIDLNKIMAEISLFKNNYQEIIKHYNN
jgi:hypothetical protein